MRRSAGLAAAILLFACGAAALAQTGLLPLGSSSFVYVGPADIVASPSGCYSLRACSTSFATSLGNAVQVNNGSNVDVPVVAGGPLNLASFATACPTSCTLAKWYDQSANARHLSQATTGNQPALPASCVIAGSTYPCAQVTTTNQLVASASNFTPATGVASFLVVGKRAAGTAGAVFIQEDGARNRVSTAGSANSWGVFGTSGNRAQTASDAAWHVGIGVLNGASSFMSVDCANGSQGSVTASTVAGLIGAMVGVTGITIDGVELVFWDNVALSTTQITNLTHNARLFWHTPGSC